jgi:hypothetical protein
VAIYRLLGFLCLYHHDFFNLIGFFPLLVTDRLRDLTASPASGLVLLPASFASALYGSSNTFSKHWTSHQ